MQKSIIVPEMLLILVLFMRQLSFCVGVKLMWW